MAKRGDGAPYSVIIPISETRTTGVAGAAAGAPGNDCARFYVPSFPDSVGIVVRSAKLFVSDEIGTATGQFDINNQTTTMLTTSLSVTAVGSADFTLAGDGQEVVAAGRYIRIDAGQGAGTWNATSGFAGCSVQIDYDRL